MFRCVSGINKAFGIFLQVQKARMIDSSEPGSETAKGDNDPGLDRTTLEAELQQLRIEHKDISDAVEALEAIGQSDQLQIRRFKRRKLILKDRIRQIEDQLTPDIIA